MLSAMFSGRFNLPKDNNGSIFIDRDGTHFRYILNYLRDKSVNLPNDKTLYKDLLNEAIFYQMEEFVDILKELIKRS